MAKARRLATKALDFEDEDDELNSADYDLLLSAAGATEKSIDILRAHQQVLNIPAGSAVAWKARVKKHEIGFAVREQLKGNDYVDIEPLTKYRSDTQIQGQLPASNQPRNIILVFDNTHSGNLKRKQVAYWIAIGANVSLDDDTLGAARTKEVTAADEGPLE